MSTLSKTDLANNTQTSFWQQHWRKGFALLFWLLVAGGYFWYANTNDLTPTQMVQQLADLFRSPYGPAIYIVLYALRPIIFFPATIITLAGGSIFGPLWGLLYVLIGSNASATVAYLIGRYFGQGVLDQEESAGIIHKYATRMRENSFVTIFIMRLIFLPYDLVNYLGGFLRTDYKAFILATILGSIPGTISFVLFGASFDISNGMQKAETNPWTLVASVVIFLISLAISRFATQREQARSEGKSEPTK